MTIKILGKAMVVTSTIKMEDLEYLAKTDKDALTIKDPEGNDLYKVQTGPAALSKAGASFDAANANGFAEMTIIIPGSIATAKRKEWVKDNYAAAIINLTANEDMFVQYADTLKDAFNTAVADIEVL